MSGSSKRPVDREPSMRERLRPVELLVFALVLALFVGLIVLLSTREPVLSLVFFGVAFIVGLVGLALFGLSVKPTPGEAEADAAELAEREAADPRPEPPADSAPDSPAAGDAPQA